MVYVLLQMENKITVVSKLQEFMEYEARSCSIDFGCVTPLYVYRMWGGVVAIGDIEGVLQQIKSER